MVIPMVGSRVSKEMRSSKVGFPRASLHLSLPWLVFMEMVSAASNLFAWGTAVRLPLLSALSASILMI